MGLRIRKLLPILLIAIIAISCFAGCSSEPKNAVSKKYKTLPYGDYVVISDVHVAYSIGEGDILMFSTFDEYEESHINGLPKDEGFFDENALLVIRFRHSMGNDPLDLVDIAIKNGKLYPVISMELAPDQNSTAGADATLYVVDVKKSDIENYSFGEVLAINLADETRGSQYHEKFE